MPATAVAPTSPPTALSPPPPRSDDLSFAMNPVVSGRTTIHSSPMMPMTRYLSPAGRGSFSSHQVNDSRTALIDSRDVPHDSIVGFGFG